MSEKSEPRKISPEALKGVSGGNNPFQNTGGGPGQNTRLNDFDNNQMGTGGNDTIHAMGGNDTVNGGAGNDWIEGGSGNDWIVGGAGADEIHGDQAGDQWNGGSDGLDGGAGDNAADRVYAGGGDDSYQWRPGDGNDTFWGEAGTDTLVLNNVSLQQFQSGLNLHQWGLTPRDEGNGYWSFRDANGNVAEISGTFSINGQTVTFYGTEFIRLI